MELKVMAHLAAESFLSIHSKEWDVICIVNSDQPNLNNIFQHSKDIEILCFDDIDCPMFGFTAPIRSHVEAAIRFAKDKTKLLVTCHNGITRSAALAYIIKCDEFKNPRCAINILNRRFYPNKLVIKFGSEILNNPKIYELYDNWVIKPKIEGKL